MGREHHPGGDDLEHGDPPAPAFGPGGHVASGEDFATSSGDAEGGDGGEAWRDSGSGWGGENEAADAAVEARAFERGFGRDDGF